MRNILPTNLVNTSFQNRREIYPEILKFHILQDRPHYHLEKNPDQIMLPHIFVSFCFCDPMSSNNLTNRGCFC